MRSFTIALPEQPTDKVLVFLHGVGEAFIPIPQDDATDRAKLYQEPPGDLLSRTGLKNVFHHGLPKLLYSPGEHAVHKPGGSWPDLPFSLSLFREFNVIIPQTALREDNANADKVNGMMETVLGLARKTTANPKIGLLGFSRGGYAAFHLARHCPEVMAVVTMDAAPPKVDLEAFKASLSDLPKPVWAFYADYSGCKADFDERITQVHRSQLKAREVDAQKGLPADNLCKTLWPTAGDATTRHNQVCNDVCGLPVVYEWLTERLQVAKPSAS